MKTLECSSKGDKRFSAFYAKVKAFGKYGSIENHYQLAKRFGNEKPATWRDSKGKEATHIELDGREYELRFLTQWYKLLWLKYLDLNPSLVEHARHFDRFNDIFKGKSVNCQADVIEQYVKRGRESIVIECAELSALLREVKQNDGL
jgi:hypothetical protein